MKIKFIAIALLVAGQLTIANAQRRSQDPKLVALLNQKDEGLRGKQLDSLTKTDKEEDLNLLVGYYSAKQDAVNRDKIAGLVLQRYPNGLTAFNNIFNKIYDENDPYVKEKLYKEMVSRWPSNPAGVRGLGIDASRYYVAAGFLGKNKPGKVVEYLDMIQDTAYKTNAFSYAARESIEAGDHALGERLIKKTFADVARRGGAKPQGYDEYLRIYSLLLYHNGKYNEGFKFAEELYNYPTDSELSKKNYRNIYMNYLIAMNRLKEAYPFIEEQLKDGAGTPAMRAKFKAAYVASKGNEAGFQELQTQIDAGIKQKIKIELAKKMRAEPAFNFTMKDLSGKNVRLSDYKGKVVILDFWATWCGPCKASFPMMQQAVNKFKDDKDVVFLFIHTLENSPDAPKLAAEYIRGKQYTFNVLMDMKDPKTNVNPGAAGYKVQGIPSKFVIDKTGIIRFSSLGGGSAGEEAFLEEMSAMIEMARG